MPPQEARTESDTEAPGLRSSHSRAGLRAEQALHAVARPSVEGDMATAWAQSEDQGWLPGGGGTAGEC